MAARKKVTLKGIVNSIDRKVDILTAHRREAGVDKEQIDLALGRLSRVRKKCIDECRDFSIFPFPGKGPRK